MIASPELAFGIFILDIMVFVVGNNTNSTVYVMNTATNTIIKKINLSEYEYGGIVIANNGYAYVIHGNSYLGGSGNITVIDTSTNTITTEIPVCRTCYEFGNVAIAPNGYIYIPSDNGSYNGDTIFILDPTTNTIISSIKIPNASSGEAITITPTGYAYTLNNTYVMVINTATNTLTDSISLYGDSPSGISSTSDGKLVYVPASQSNIIFVINTTTNTIVKNISYGNYGNIYGGAAGPSLVQPIPFP